ACLVFIISLGWSFFRSHALDLLLVDEDLSASLGISIERLQVEIVLMSSLLSAVAVSIAGLIGFVGLIAPHLASTYFKSLRAKTHPLYSAMMGSCILV